MYIWKRHYNLLFLFIFTSISFLFVHGNSFALNFLGLRTSDIQISLGNTKTYINPDSIDDTVIGTTIANMSLGAGEYRSSGSRGKTFFTLETASGLIHADIMKIIQGSHNPSLALETHGLHIKNIDTSLQNQIQQIKDDIAHYTQNAQICFNTKNEGDKLFAQGLQTNDANTTEQGIQKAKQGGSCYIENMIQIYASLHILKRMQNIQSLTQKKYNFVKTVGPKLVEYKDILHTKSLTDVQNAYQALSQRNNTINTASGGKGSLGGTNILFNKNRNIHDLPDFSSIVPLNNNPSYQRPWNREW